MPQHPLLDIIADATGPAPLRLCVGFSGGSDSVALLHALHTLGHECHALHCNFHLRGDESDRDEAFCRSFCQRMGIPMEVVQCDVKSECERTGISMEMAARDLRYRAFERFREHNSLDVTAVAHHREDNIETFFLNLLRGSGVKGLAGMSRHNRNHVLRPMLRATKTLVMDYVETNSLEYVTDSTNAADDFKRNRIRHHVLPMLEQHFPGALDAIARSMEVLTEQALTLDGDTRRLNDTYRRSDGTIDVASLKANEVCPPDALYRLLGPHAFSKEEVNAMLGDVNATGRRFGYWEMRRGILYPPAANRRNVQIAIERVTLTHPDQLRCSKDTLLLDPAAVDPAKLRLWQAYDGLRLDPYGMNGSKLVSDILKEGNVTLERRRDYPVLYYEDKLIWVVGVRASRHFTLSRDSQFPLEAIKVVASGY